MDMSLSKLRELAMDRGGLACCSPWGHKELVAIEEINTHTQSGWTIQSDFSRERLSTSGDAARGPVLEEQPQFSGKVRQHLEGRIDRGKHTD